MKTILFFIFTLSIFTQSHSQNNDFFKDNPVWYYNFYCCEIFACKEGWERFKVVGDTIIQGKTCKIIERCTKIKVVDFFGNIISGYDIGSRPDTYMYDTLGVIYEYYGENEEFKLALDFSKEVGDTIKYPLSNQWDCDTDSLVFVIEEKLLLQPDSIYSIKWQRIDNNDISFEFPWAFVHYSDRGPLINFTIAPNVDFDCNNGIECGTPYTSLSCFSNDSLESCHEFDNLFCDEIVLDIELRSKQSVSIFPNPVSDYLNIDGFENLSKLQVFDINGILLFEKQHRLNKIDLSTLTRGVYFIKLFDMNSTPITDIIIKN